MSKGKQRKCRICKKRPPWQYKNCPPGICKRCYHSHVWEGNPRRSREVTEPEPFELDLADLEQLELSDLELFELDPLDTGPFESPY